jgi:hypothetical protein
MTSNQKSELKKILTEVVINHWDKYLKSKLKKDLIGGKLKAWDTQGEDVDFLLASTLSRSYDSSRGNLWEKILFEISTYYNDKTFKKIKGLKLKSNGREWIVDLAFERNGKTYLIELKLGGELDNKKALSEAKALFERKNVLLESKIASDVETYLGIITLSNGENNPTEWNMGRVQLGFDRSEVFVERELFDFVSNDTDLFEFIKTEIQPIAMREWKLVKEKIKSTYL